VPVQFSWPPAFRFLTASVQDPMAADINIDASVLRERSVGYLNRRRHGTAFPFAAILPPFCRQVAADVTRRSHHIWLASAPTRVAAGCRRCAGEATTLRKCGRRERSRSTGRTPRTLPGEAPIERYRDQTPGRSRIRVAPAGVCRTRPASNTDERRQPGCAIPPTHHRVAPALRGPAHPRPRRLRLYGPGGPGGRGAYRWVIQGPPPARP